MTASNNARFVQQWIAYFQKVHFHKKAVDIFTFFQKYCSFLVQIAQWSQGLTSFASNVCLTFDLFWFLKMTATFPMAGIFIRCLSHADLCLKMYKPTLHIFSKFEKLHGLDFLPGHLFSWKPPPPFYEICLKSAKPFKHYEKKPKSQKKIHWQHFHIKSCFHGTPY